MKNLSLALNGALVIAVIVLFYLHFSGPSNEVATEETVTVELADSTVQVAPSELIEDAFVGYVNIDSLQERSELYSELIERLKASQKRLDRELNSKLTAFEQKKIDFQKRAPTMSQFEGENEYKQLMKEQEELYQLRDKFAVKFQEEEGKLGKQFEDELKDFIKAYNEDKKYHIIIGSSILGNQVLYFDEGINISNDVINGLNDLYAKKKAEKSNKAEK